MLTAPVHDADRYVLVASRGGDPRHPPWYLNLLADPDVEVTVRGRTLRMHARTATVKEHAEPLAEDHRRVLRIRALSAEDHQGDSRRHLQAAQPATHRCRHGLSRSTFGDPRQRPPVQGEHRGSLFARVGRAAPVPDSGRANLRVGDTAPPA